MFTEYILRVKKHLIILPITLMFTLIILSTSASASLITTYYWDDGWIEHATWETTVGKDLTINIDAWNWEPEYSAFNVKFDNIIAIGDIDPITNSQGLIDDFNDGIVKSIWNITSSSGSSIYESDGF